MPRNSEEAVGRSDTLYRYFSEPDEAWFLTGVGREGRPVAQPDWMQVIHPTRAGTVREAGRFRAAQSLVCQLLLFSPPARRESPAKWVTKMSRLLNARPGPHGDSSAGPPGFPALNKTFYSTGKAPAPWNRIYGPVAPADLQEALMLLLDCLGCEDRGNP